MPDDNKKNLLYFESETMRGLYECMEEWQDTNRKRFQSTSIHQDGGKFCCIALSNPSEVIIVSGVYYENNQAEVVDNMLLVKTQ